MAKSTSKLRIIEVDRFASIRNIEICFTCRSCIKGIAPPVDEKVEIVQCTKFKCGAKCFVSKLKSRITAEINVDIDDDDIGLTILNKELVPLLPMKVIQPDDVENILEGMENFQVEYDVERSIVKRIISLTEKEEQIAAMSTLAENKENESNKAELANTIPEK